MEITSILLVLQTHTNSSRDETQHRYCEAPKSEVSRRCLKSLVKTINYANRALAGIEIQLQVFDDHSDNLEAVEEVLSQLTVPYVVTPLETRGIMPSILRCYEHGKDYGKQIVYFIQDDYLYYETALWEMIVDYQRFSIMIGVDHLSFFPWNDPYRYWAHNTVEVSHIVQGVRRHYRTNMHPSCCFLTHIDVIRDNWDLFYAMGTSRIHKYMEMETIGKLFIDRGYWMFSPIPSQALHMQFEVDKDPYIDWRTLWDANV